MIAVIWLPSPPADLLVLHAHIRTYASNELATHDTACNCLLVCHGVLLVTECWWSRFSPTHTLVQRTHARTRRQCTNTSAPVSFLVACRLHGGVPLYVRSHPDGLVYNLQQCTKTRAASNSNLLTYLQCALAHPTGALKRRCGHGTGRTESEHGGLALALGLRGHKIPYLPIYSVGRHTLCAESAPKLCVCTEICNTRLQDSGTII